MPTRSLSVVIPAFNEERRLEARLREISAFLDDRGHDGEIVVVDDGSRDRTADLVRGLGTSLPRVRLLCFSPNHGKGFAVREGVLASNRAAVLITDADQSTPIREVERLWPWFDQGREVVIGSRHAAGSGIVVRQPFLRRIAGRVFNLVVASAGLRGIADTQCGFKLFRGDVAKAVFSRLRTDGFAFDVEALLRARALGCRIQEVPVTWHHSGDSRVRMVRDSFGMVLEVLKLRFVS